MSQACPDWRTLTAHRTAPSAADTVSEPSGWGDALAHLDGCPACRRSALAADPTLLFRRLPSPFEAGSGSSGLSDTDEVEAMMQAVTTLRTMERVEEAREGTTSRWRWLAAAVLALAALALGPGRSLGPLPASTLAALAPDAPYARTVLPAATRVSTSQAVPMPPMPPMVEELNRPAARVYQMDGGGDLSVVMIVDERFDV